MIILCTYKTFKGLISEFLLSNNSNEALKSLHVMVWIRQPISYDQGSAKVRAARGPGSICESSWIRAGSGLSCRAPGSRLSRIFSLRLNQKEHLREECHKRVKNRLNGRNRVFKTIFLIPSLNKNFSDFFVQKNY